MSALPLEVKSVLAAALVLSVARAFLGRPAPSVHERLARTLVGFAICLYVLAAEALVTGDEGLAGAFLVCGIEALCLAAWVGRRRDDGDGGDGGGGGGDDGPDGPGPIDWDAFDRERAGWRIREPIA
jgi:hypothetical protein